MLVELDSMAIGVDTILRVAAAVVAAMAPGGSDSTTSSSSSSGSGSVHGSAAGDMPLPPLSSSSTSGDLVQATAADSDAAGRAGPLAAPLQLRVQLSRCQVLCNSVAERVAPYHGGLYAEFEQAAAAADAGMGGATPNYACQALLDLQHLQLALMLGEGAAAPGAAPPLPLASLRGLSVLLLEGSGSEHLVPAVRVPTLQAAWQPSAAAAVGGSGSLLQLNVSVPQVDVSLQPNQLVMLVRMCTDKVAAWVDWVASVPPTATPPPAAAADLLLLSTQLEVGAVRLLLLPSTEHERALLLEWLQLQAFCGGGSSDSAEDCLLLGRVAWQDARLLLCPSRLDLPGGGPVERVHMMALPALCALARAAAAATRSGTSIAGSEPGQALPAWLQHSSSFAASAGRGSAGPLAIARSALRVPSWRDSGSEAAFFSPRSSFRTSSASFQSASGSTMGSSSSSWAYRWGGCSLLLGGCCMANLQQGQPAPGLSILLHIMRRATRCKHAVMLSAACMMPTLPPASSHAGPPHLVCVPLPRSAERPALPGAPKPTTPSSPLRGTCAAPRHTPGRQRPQHEAAAAPWAAHLRLLVARQRAGCPCTGAARRPRRAQRCGHQLRLMQSFTPSLGTAWMATSTQMQCLRAAAGLQARACLPWG